MRQEGGDFMQYNDMVTLKDGRKCVIRNAMSTDAYHVLVAFRTMQAQTDYLLTYSEEITMTVKDEVSYITKKEQSPRGLQLCALIDDQIVGLASINALGDCMKIKHRVEFGICIEKNYWHLGIGTALLEACIKAAKKASFQQMELEVVATNKQAIDLYKKMGFKEYGRNQRGFITNYGHEQELILMSLDLR